MKIEINEELLNLLGNPASFHDYSGPNYSEFNPIEGKTVPVIPANPQAETFADALLGLVAAKIRLEAIRRDEPRWSRDPGNEVQAYNRAADRVWQLVRGN